MFKSTNGMCSHSLLAASLNGQVDTFVSHYAKFKAPVNYAKLGQHGLPLGGKRKVSSKKTTSSVKEILSLADDLQRSKRASGAHHVSNPPSSLLSDNSSSSLPSYHQHSQSPTCSVNAAQVHPSKRARTISSPHHVSDSPSFLPSDHQRSHFPVYGVSVPNTSITSVSNTANFLSSLSQPPPLVHVSPQSSLQALSGTSLSVGQPDV